MRLDWARTRKADLESITAGDLTALAKVYLVPDWAFRIKVSPGASALASGRDSLPIPGTVAAQTTPH